jgi:hypothetical protein
MTNLGYDYASIMMHEARLREILQKAEEERKVLSLREKIETRIRRTLRINND